MANQTTVALAIGTCHSEADHFVDTIFVFLLHQVGHKMLGCENTVTSSYTSPQMRLSKFSFLPCSVYNQRNPSLQRPKILVPE